MTKNKLALCMIPLMAGSLTACLDEELTSDTSQFVPYNLDNVTYPNDLLKTDADGTLELPVESSGDEVDYRNYENVYGALDGWSTGYPIVLPISGPSVELETATLTANTYILNAKTGELLVPNDDYVVEVTESGDIQILPKIVLPESTPFIIALSDGITDIAGTGLKRSNDYQRLLDGNNLGHSKGDAAVTQVQSNHSQLEAAGVQGEIVYSAQFTTQSIYPVMDAAIGNIPDQAVENVAAINNKPNAKVWSYSATIKVPYYLELPERNGENGTCEVPQLYSDNTDGIQYKTVAADKVSHCEALYSWWKGANGEFVHSGNPEPVATIEELEIPVIIYAPNGWTPGASALPATIIVHGITGTKEAAMTMTERGTGADDQDPTNDRLVIAIDQPLHGERGIDLDKDGTIDITASAGEVNQEKSVYLNLLSALTLRDNQRQAVLDQLVLRKALNNTGFVDSTDVSLIGHSLGGIISTMVSDLSQNQPELNFNTVTLVVPGMHLTDLVMNSPLLGGEVENEIRSSSDIQLAVASMVGVYDEETQTKVEGLDALEAYKAESTENAENAAGIEDMVFDMVAAEMYPGVQTAVDGGDPANFIKRQFENKQQPILLVEAAGTCDYHNPETCEEGVDYIPDNVVVNDVPGKPLVGTEPLIKHLELEAISETTSSVTNTGLRGVLRAKHGGHGTYLFPYEGPVTYKDPLYPQGRPMTYGDTGFTGHLGDINASMSMQQQAIVSFIESGGKTIEIEDSNIVH
ncbi:hypothetical protein C9I98_17400 [Photobacterium sanctipauli]|uniref:Bacterial virulence factor lipase N-terminal domain-containing protein n=1 Tax=Photobacterium sanctipauli TaxID=1342794 RepID=A0A2T3NPI2_9GAMM|nr:hypothetical protein [Photobacterium sanctipauli]PSW18158.1 hypothetical protein C9I98_17400 [Photobacterium sanctipauli]